MSFAIDFAIEFSSLKINLKSDKYLSNTSNPILLMRHYEVLRPKKENEDKKDIENLGLYCLLSKRDI